MVHLFEDGAKIKIPFAIHSPSFMKIHLVFDDLYMKLQEIFSFLNRLRQAFFSTGKFLVLKPVGQIEMKQL